MNEVFRGTVYKYRAPVDGVQRYALVISADARGRDRYVSILFLTDAPLGHDVIKVTVPAIGVKYVHCGMITYTQRENLIEDVTTVSDYVMSLIDGTILSELGIKHDAEVELNIYKDLYNQLLYEVGDALRALRKDKGE